MRRLLRDILAIEDDRAVAGLRAAADRHHQRRLAGAIGADQAHDLATVDMHVNPVERTDIAVERLYALDFQERFISHQMVPSSSFSSISSTSSSSTPR
jgi:hypothetical protein